MVVPGRLTYTVFQIFKRFWRPFGRGMEADSFRLQAGSTAVRASTVATEFAHRIWCVEDSVIQDQEGGWGWATWVPTQGILPSMANLGEKCIATSWAIRPGVGASSSTTVDWLNWDQVQCGEQCQHHRIHVGWHTLTQMQKHSGDALVWLPFKQCGDLSVPLKVMTLLRVIPTMAFCLYILIVCLAFNLTFHLGFYLAFCLTYTLTFCLTYTLTFYLAFNPTYSLNSIRHSTWHIFWHSIWQIFWHSFWHIFWQYVWRLRSMRCKLRSDPGGWGPAVHTAIGPWRMRSSGAHFDPELAKRMGGTLGDEDWRGGEGEGEEGGEGVVLIKSSNPHLAGGEKTWFPWSMGFPTEKPIAKSSTKRRSQAWKLGSLKVYESTRLESSYIILLHPYGNHQCQTPRPFLFTLPVLDGLRKLEVSAA